MAVRRAQVDRVVDVTRPRRLADVDARTELVVTRHGLVVVDREGEWTWYRWVMAGQWWSVTVPVAREPRAAEREAARLIGACRERYRRRASVRTS